MASSLLNKIKPHTEPSTSVFSKVPPVTPEWKLQQEAAKGELAGLPELIEQGYMNGQVNKFSKKKSFSPSTLVWNEGICPRYWYLAFDGAVFERDNTGRQITNMDSGTDRHARIQEGMEKAGIIISNEEVVKFVDPPIGGKVDSVIRWNNEEWVVEIKTCPDAAFDRHKRSMSASPYHLIQLLIYMKYFKKKRGIIMYENKNTHELLCIPVHVNNKHVEFIDYLFDWMRRTYKAWEGQTIPMVPFRNNDVKICQNCPLQKACKAAPEGTLKIEKRKDEKGLF